MEAQQQLLQAHHQQYSNSEGDFDVSHQRRSANYKPSLWKYDFLTSLDSKYDRKEYTIEAEKLVKDVTDVFEKRKDLRATLELIDGVKKLGLANYFEEEVKKALGHIAPIFMNGNYSVLEDDIYFSSLCFRLLREQGFQVSQDIFSGLVDVISYERRILNIESMVQILEATNIAFEGENTLKKAKEFSEEILKNHVTSFNGDNDKDTIIVNHVLELPLHWRVNWFDVKWQINAYETNVIHSNNDIKILLPLAKLNYNMVQSKLQKDLKELSSWWKKIGITEKLAFARDRLVESFMCTVGLASQHQYTCLRKCLTKVVNFILIIDDVYDVYGSLQELKQFTIALNRWDLRETDQLPDCMKDCFQILYDTTFEIAKDIENEIGFDQVLILPHLKKLWADFCNSLLVEAEWYHNGYTPSFEEYLSNACISSSGPLLLLHSFFCIKQEVSKDVSHYFLDQQNHDLVYHISLIIRLCNDLGTSAAEQERGDAPSSIVCYMKEMKVTEDIARNHIRDMIVKSWHKINAITFASNVTPSPFINIALNAARVAHNLYKSGDAFSDQVTDNKKHILSILVEPLPFSF